MKLNGAYVNNLFDTYFKWYIFGELFHALYHIKIIFLTFIMSAQVFRSVTNSFPSVNFGRNKVSSRMKFNQILGAFQDSIENPTIPNYVCAPCSNCKGASRDILEFYEATDKFNVQYGGLVELMVNALVSMDKPFMEFLEK